MKSVLLKLLFLVVCISISSCNITEQQNDTGELNVILEESRTIEPLFLMEVDSYEILGTGPSEETFHKTNILSANHRVSNLVPGYWTVTVNALNADAAVIATGEKITYVASNTSNICAVDVLPVTGSGTLTLSMDWTSMDVTTPQIIASTTDADGNIVELPFIITGSTATVTQTLTNAYYTLNIKLKDSGILVWGITEAVRVITDQTTSHDFVCEQ